MTIEGDGLLPKFGNGDVVVIDPDRIPKDGDHVVLYGEAQVTEYAGEEPGLFHVIVGRTS